MMDHIIPSGLGQPQLSGTPAAEPLAVPMMLLNLVEQLGEADEELAGKYEELGDWCTQRILQHVQVGDAWGAGGQDEPHSASPCSCLLSSIADRKTQEAHPGEAQPRALGKVDHKPAGLGGAEG
jgi:hypothetical protein